MNINDIKEWINTQKSEIPQTSAIELARTQGFFQGALRTINALESYINESEKSSKTKESGDQSKK